MATKLDSAAQRVEQAQEAAKHRATRETVGPEWPRVEDMSLDEALQELLIMVLVHGVKLGFGNSPGTADIWCRLSWPLDSEDKLAGMVAFTTSSSLERAIRKAGQLFEPRATSLWKPDRYAK